MVMRYIQTQHWGDVFLKELVMIAQAIPSSSALFPCCLCYALLISLSYSRVNATEAGDHQPCPSQSIHTFGPESMGHRAARGECHGFFCPPTNTDFLEVGVLPQQLSNHINYAASNLPTSSLNIPCLRHVARLSWKCRAPGPSSYSKNVLSLGRRELSSWGINHHIHSFYSPPPHFFIPVQCDHITQ